MIMNEKNRWVSHTLNLWTSSILANLLPFWTQDWKKLGATDTPIASDVIPVLALSDALAIALNVPNNSTKRCCVTTGSDVNNLFPKNNKNRVNTEKSKPKNVWKTCGSLLVSDRHFPTQWSGRASVPVRVQTHRTAVFGEIFSEPTLSYIQNSCRY